MVHIPELKKLTTEAAMVHTEVAEASMVKTTGLPDVPLVAATVYVGPPATAPTGGVEVKVMF
jgi:hypothetical protein